MPAPLGLVTSQPIPFGCIVVYNHHHHRTYTVRFWTALAIVHAIRTGQ